MSSRSKAQRAADARYDVKRKGQQVLLRLNHSQAEWLKSQQRTNESRAATIKRLAGIDTGRPL